MNISGTIMVFTCALSCLGSSSAPAEEPEPFVLVELFTSEGCSSCPPADDLLAELSASPLVAGTTVVPMAFHVDYWDRLGWKDPFGDPAYSQRQRTYAGLLKSESVYTPQMIVNGTVGFVGSDRRAAENAIGRAGRNAPARIKIVTAAVEGKQVKLSIGLQRLEASDLTLWAAIVENNLVSNVRRGENRGRTLKHQAVVRVFQGDDYTHPAGEADSRILSLPWAAAWKRPQCSVVVAVQSKKTGEVFALGQSPIVGPE